MLASSTLEKKQQPTQRRLDGSQVDAVLISKALPGFGWDFPAAVAGDQTTTKQLAGHQKQERKAEACRLLPTEGYYHFC